MVKMTKALLSVMFQMHLISVIVIQHNNQTDVTMDEKKIIMYQVVE